MRRHASLVLGLGLFLLGSTAALAQVPAAPSNLQAVAASDDQITLFWQNNATNATGFRIEMRTATTAYTEIGTVDAAAGGVNVHRLAPGTTYFFRVRAFNGSGNSAYSNEASATTFSTNANCTQNATTLCLNGGRFQVRATFQTGSGQSGSAQVVKLTDETGYFWFFNPANVEVVVKVLNGCGFNNRYWVFAAGLTNVRVVITVTDTATGATKTYINPLNRAFPPIQDTNAFATCQYQEP